jgi:hypothetical protein
VPNADIFQFHGVHQVMQGHMSVAAAQARKERSHEAEESDQRVPAKGAEQQIEPHHVRLKPVESLQKAEGAAWIIERPASQDVEPGGLNVIGRDFVGQNGKAEKRIALQLVSNVKTVFA